MSSYFDDASLVMIPSGYKTSKVYSVKPTDGTGDLTFTRSNSTATRVGPDGLIEKVRTNLLLQSETIDNASWSKTDVAITANTTANPLNGALTADTITLTGATSQKFIAQSLIQNGLFTQSAYLKAGTHQFVQFIVGGDIARFAAFDLVNGTSSVTGGVATITAVANGFYRCTFSYTTTVGTNMTIIAVDSLAAARAASTASTGTFIAFGCQLETGDIATDYIPTTTAAVSVGPVANVPRLDYLNSSCPRLLLEPQRTNLVLYSEQADNPYWIKTANLASWQGTGSAPVVTANYGIAPDGTMSADRVQLNLNGGTTSNDRSGYYASITVATSSTYGCSIYIKPLNGENISSIMINNVGALAAGGTETSQSYEVLANGWYRITRVFATASTIGTFRIQIIGVNGLNSLDCLIWGAQLEAGAYVTSYIPTLGAAVTRGADAASKTGISSLIGQTEGTLFAEVDLRNFDTSANQIIAELFQDSNNRIGLAMYRSGSTNRIQFYQLFGGNVEVNINTLASAGVFKLAGAYKNNDYVFYINGVQIGVDTNASIPAASSITLGTGNSGITPLGNTVKQLLLFKTRLSNSDLAALTTL